MRCSRIFLLTLLPIATPALAHGQVVDTARGQVTLQIFRFSAETSSTVSIDAVVDRVMSFDRDLDRKVAMGELPERMHALFARGDSDGDAALDGAEVRTLAQNAPRTVHQIGASGYAFADEVGLSSSSRIDGAIDDLRLDVARSTQTRAIATAFLDSREAEARATLLEDMEAVLAQERLAQFTTSLDQALRRARRLDSTRHARVNLRQVIAEYALTGEQRRGAFAALERYEDQSWLDDVEQSALVERTASILSAQERDDLRAALWRRPVVQRGTGIFDDLPTVHRAIDALRGAVVVGGVSVTRVPTP